MIEGIRDWGKMLDAEIIKKGLRELNPGIHFDVGGNLGIYHPSIEKWQGIFIHGQHLCSLDRGPSVPEFHVFGTYKKSTGAKGMLVQHIGWRHTFESLVRKQVPGITWNTLCAKFNIDYKKFQGDPIELEVA